MAMMFSGLNAEKYDRTYDDGLLFRRIASYFRPYWKNLAIVTAATLVTSVLSAYATVFIANGVDAVRANDTNTAYLFAGAVFASLVSFYFLNWIRRQLSSRMISGIMTAMRQDAFKAAVNRDLAFYDDQKSGKVVSRITSDTQEFGQVVVLTSDVISQVVEALILLVILLNRDWRLTLLLMGFMPIMLGAAVAFRKLARSVTRQGSRAMAAVNDNIQESVTGIGVAKNFRQESVIYSEFMTINRQSYRINMRRGLVLALIFPVMNALSGLGTGMMVYAGASAFLAGTIKLGAWYLFIQGVERFWFPVTSVAAFISQFQQGLSAAERVFALIDAENTLIQTDNQPVDSLRGEIHFDDVTFAYATGEKVLEHFNLKIAPGETVAFVGHTGAGKSTIAKQIARFYEFQAGNIRVDGRDIRTFDLHAYRSKLGIVSQSPFLFSGTIRENIRYGSPDATDAEIEQVANSIGHGEWLETLPNGLDSDVGERGARLSMGQRQLVSLVRVLVQRPAIFILDEATASVDPFTEMQIQEALELILSQATSILIAHRLSTVRSADRIIVLKEGKIIEEGSHETLIAQSGHYAELYNTYFRHQSLEYIEKSRDVMPQ